MKCREVPEMLSEDKIKMTFKQRVGLSYHLMICGYCRRISKIFNLFDKKIHSLVMYRADSNDRLIKELIEKFLKGH